MKKLRRMGLLLLGGLLITSNVLAAGVSKSKSATSLSDDNISKVTLSLPSDEEKLTSDIVFVLDKSTSADAESKALKMLASLQKRIGENNAKVQVGIVIFNKTATKFGFYDLNTQYDEIEKAIKTTISSGTNLHAGILAGTEMLESDKKTDDSRKNLILVSDGYTYLFNDEKGNTSTVLTGIFSACETFETCKNNLVPYQLEATIENYNLKYEGDKTIDTDEKLEELLSKTAKNFKKDGYSYAQVYESTYDKNTFLLHRVSTISDSVWEAILAKYPGMDEDDHANSVDMAIYLAVEAYKSAAKKYNLYTVADPGRTSTYNFGKPLLKYLSSIDEKEVDFNNIENDIYYLVSSGTTVKDIMGYGDNYNFDFVNKASDISLKVGDKTYEAIEVEKNTYAFNDGMYVIEYFPESDNNKHDYFVWTINTDVSNFERVSLTYKVQLMEAPTEAGTYELYTNKEATITPVDSNEKEGTIEEFDRPSVKFVVESAEGGEEKEETKKEEKYEKPEVYTGVSSLVKTSSIVIASIGMIGLISLLIIKRKN